MTVLSPPSGYAIETLQTGMANLLERFEQLRQKEYSALHGAATTVEIETLLTGDTAKDIAAYISKINTAVDGVGRSLFMNTTPPSMGRVSYWMHRPDQIATGTFLGGSVVLATGDGGTFEAKLRFLNRNAPELNRHRKYVEAFFRA